MILTVFSGNLGRQENQDLLHDSWRSNGSEFKQKECFLKKKSHFYFYFDYRILKNLDAINDSG